MVFDQVFWNALLHVLQEFAAWFTEQIDGGAQVVLGGIISLVRDLPFITQTDLGLVNSLNNLIGWSQVLPLVDAVLRLGLLLAAAAYAGHQMFGWRALPDSIQRWGCALILTRVSYQLQDLSLQAMDAITHGIAVSLPDFPNIESVNPLIVVVLMLVWAILLFRLVLVCAERIAWLVVLRPLGPLASMFWAIPQTAWIADRFWKLWIGWLIGQFFVVLAVAAMVLMINRGGIEGYFLSCAALVVAQKAISMFVPTGDAGLLRVGPLKV